METSNERRTSRRFTMALPLKVRALPGDEQEVGVKTRDVSFKGLYFMSNRGYDVGSKIEFVLTLPREITLATDVNIRCTGCVVRREDHAGRSGIAARIERYEFVPQE